jgi:hypothetical protein
LGFKGCFAVNSDGLSGGIRLFWSSAVEVDLKSFSQGHIDVMVTMIDKDIPQPRLKGFYGAPRVKDRHHSWRCLRTLYAVHHNALLCMGDFNEMMYADEHFSSAMRPE